MTPSITDIISNIKDNQAQLGITLYDKASSTDIYNFENIKNVKLPYDIKAFYSFSNGFESNEDIFRIIPLDEIIKNKQDSYTVGQHDFHIAEYMIYSDMWTININHKDSNDYSIYNKADNIVTLTNSFADFLNRFLIGGVFDGLYDWREKIEQTLK